MAPKELHLRLTWRDTRGTLLPVRRAASYHVFFFLADSRQCGSDLGRFTLNQVNLGHIGHIGRNRQNGRFRPKFPKKKKKVQNALFELNNKSYFSSLHPNTKLQLFLTPSLISHSFCALCLSVSALRLPCGCKTLSHLVTSFKL